MKNVEIASIMDKLFEANGLVRILNVGSSARESVKDNEVNDLDPWTK